jgi:hypothetical protein
MLIYSEPPGGPYQGIHTIKIDTYLRVTMNIVDESTTEETRSKLPLRRAEEPLRTEKDQTVA